MKKSLIHTYYARYSQNKTSLERKLERMQHDPIRYYEGTNEKVSLLPIKGRRLG